MISLHLRMMLLLGTLFAVVYAIVVMVGTAMGVTSFYVYLWISLAMMFFQYLIGPKIVEWTMQVRYITPTENPKLTNMVKTLAEKSRLPMPRIGISPAPIPNAFAFGRGHRDGRICVTQGILRLLNDDELRAVIGHEMTHIKNRDVLTITLLSVIPMIMYRLAWHFIFYGGRRDDRNSGNTVLIGLAAFLFYFITNLLVLYASRIREYYADQGSIALGNKPAAMATALYKLVYGAARTDKESLREIEGVKAFFVNDPSRAMNEIKELSQLDMDKNGIIDSAELAMLRHKNLNLNFGDRMMEMLSTHPNMLKRIKALTAQQV